MNRNDVINQLTEDAVLMSKWRAMCKDGTLGQMLELCNCFRRPYNKEGKPSEVPHIQSEYNGGMKAWDKLEYLLQSLPFKENKELDTTSEEYVGFVKDHVAIRKQNEYDNVD